MSSKTALARILEAREKNITTVNSRIPKTDLVEGAVFVPDTDHTHNEELEEERLSGDEELYQNNAAKRLKQDVQLEEEEFVIVDGNTSTQPLENLPVVTKNGINPLMFARKYLYDADTKSAKLFTNSKVAERLSKPLDVQYLLQRASSADTETETDINLMLATMAVSINKMAKGNKTLTTAKDDEKEKLSFNIVRARQVNFVFTLPDHTSYTFLNFVDNNMIEKSLGKGIFELSSIICRGVFKKILEVNPKLAVMTLRTSEDIETEWLPIPNSVIGFIAEIILVGVGKGELDEETFEDLWLRLKDKTRVVLVNMLESERKRIRKRTDGAKYLADLKKDAVKPAAEQQETTE